MGKVLLGILIGLGIAGGVVFFLNKAPNPFTNNQSLQQNDKKSEASNPITLVPGTQMAVASDTLAQGTKNKPDASEPKYDFYDVLQGKKQIDSAQTQPPEAPQNTAPVVKQKAAETTNTIQQVVNNIQNKPATSVAIKSSFIVQIGAFSNAASASDVKAQLAISGFNPKIASKNGITKVFLGPFNNKQQAQNTQNDLKQQSINSTIIKIGE
ncbi:MAG: SPOR domain-containing protein [Burkholderiales bacterium]|nr:SPOR domain-containing protein [Burkholderiales bacterium]